jgi:hypothetical protein
MLDTMRKVLTKHPIEPNDAFIEEKASADSSLALKALILSASILFLYRLFPFSWLWIKSPSIFLSINQTNSEKPDGAIFEVNVHITFEARRKLELGKNFNY